MDDPFADIPEASAAPAVSTPVGDDPFADIPGALPKALADTEDQVSRTASRPKPSTPLFEDIYNRNDLVRLAGVMQERQQLLGPARAAQKADIAAGKIADDVLNDRDALERDLWSRVDTAYKATRKSPPEMTFTEAARGAFDAAVTEPTRFASEFAKEFVANPQYLLPFLQEMGLAKLPIIAERAGKAGQAAVRAADAAIVAAPIAGVSSAIRQEQEHGEVTPGNLFNDMAVASAFTGMAQPLLAAVGAGMALGVRKSAKINNKVITPDNVGEATIKVGEEIKGGKTPEAAVREVLDEMKVPDPEADAIAKGVGEATVEPKAAPDVEVPPAAKETPTEPKIEPAKEAPTEPLEPNPQARTDDLPEIEIPKAGEPDSPVPPDPAAPTKHDVLPVDPVDLTLGKAMFAQMRDAGHEVWFPLSKALTAAQEAFAARAPAANVKPPWKNLGEFTKFVQASNIPDAFKVLLSAATDGIEHVPITLRKLSDNVAGRYVLTKTLDQVQLHPGYFNPKHPWKTLIDVIHEATHARVASTVRAKPNLPPVQALRALHDYLRKRFDLLPEAQRNEFSRLVTNTAEGKERPYGFFNLQEFIAEVGSNPRFMDELRSFNLPDSLMAQLRKTAGGEAGMFKTAWKAATTLFGKIMGVKPEETRAFGVAYDLVSQLHKEVTPASRAESNRVLIARSAEGKVFYSVAADQVSKGEINGVMRAGQSGAVDPKLLAVLGLAGAGATATWIFTHDPVKTAGAAIAAGAFALAGMRPVRAVLNSMGFHADQRYRITHLTDQYSGMIASGELATQRMRVALDELVKDPQRQMAVRDWLEGDAAHRQANPLTPRERAYADAIEQGLAGGGQKLVAIGMDPVKLLDSYLTHMWVPGLNTSKSVWENLKAAVASRADHSPGMSPHSRFSMKRTIPTYADGIAMGLIPVTNNPAAILQLYLNNVNKALANKQLQGALLRERTPWGERLMVVDMPEAAMKEVLKRDAIHASQMQLSDAEKKMLQDMHASIRAPAEYVTIDHPQMRGFKVHKDVEAPLKHLYDANEPNAATRAAYAVSVAAKRGLFSYSLFHAKSLVDALLGTGIGALRKLPEARAKLQSGSAGDALDQLVRGGMRVTGRPIEGDITPFTNALRLIGEKYPIVGAPAKALNFITQKMDTFLWDFVHPTFKAAAGLAEYEKALNKRPNVPQAQVAKEVASYVNDVFGSVDWFKIADGVQSKYGRDLALAVTAPSGRRFMQIAMLAPDWTVATGRSLLKAIPGVSDKAVGAMHRAYFVRSAIVYATVADALNVAFSGHHFWQNEDPTTVDLGDGRRLQLSKHFMEGIHWLTKPGQQALNKLGYVPAEGLKQLFNQDYLSQKGAPPIRTTNPNDTAAQTAVKQVGQSVAHAAKAPLPITMQQGMTNTPAATFSGFLGFPVLGKDEEQAVQEARQRAEKQGKDVTAAEKRMRKTYRKKDAKQEALR